MDFVTFVQSKTSSFPHFQQAVTCLTLPLPSLLFLLVPTKRCHHPLSPKARLYPSHFFWWPGKSWSSINLCLQLTLHYCCSISCCMPATASCLLLTFAHTPAYHHRPFTRKVALTGITAIQLFVQTKETSVYSFLTSSCLLSCKWWLSTLRRKGRRSVTYTTTKALMEGSQGCVSPCHLPEVIVSGQTGE